MSHRLLLPLVVLAAGCATEPTTASGAVAHAQESYDKALFQCQEAHRDEVSTDAGMGVAPTKEDADFSACMTQAKANLEVQMREAQNEDAGTGG